MSKEDYSKVSSVLLSETGLLSSTSLDLKTYLAINSIKTVSDLLRFDDEPTNHIGYIYYDTLLEMRGFVDLVRRKYFDRPFVTDIYFNKPIKYLSFDGLSSSFCSYGVVGNDGKKKDIYVLINRLGFNDKERSRILYVTENYLEGRLLIDLLSDAYDRISASDNFGKDEEVLCNKLLVILEYYLIRYKYDVDSDFVKNVNKKIIELGDVLARKHALDLLNNKLQRAGGEMKK